MQEELTKIMNSKVNITVLRERTFIHLLRIAATDEEIFVHFLSRDRSKHTTWNGSEITEMYLPDHVSYHQDGTVHLKHKKGQYSNVPIRLPHKFLSLDRVFDLPLMAISFYEKGFKQAGSSIGIELSSRPDGHTIVESCNITFTIVIYIRDLLGKPQGPRCIDIMAMPGGIVPSTQDATVLQGLEGVPKYVACFNPSLEQLHNDLRLFQESEIQRVGEFMERASNSFEGHQPI